MKEPDQGSLKSFIEAGADLLDLPLDSRWMPAIQSNLSVTLGHAALVAEAELPDDAEPAPVFKA
jgi:hypothetical protein